ncbi:54S ribosomal protein L2 mitochondrial [Dermatophagoides pteronyssinus]|uniref:54S ribosomal protein L2 mitochondrial n=1 Tax=Dermatophagoides pteronyssinus TaxID=6956 RepID=A0ABQ8ISM2_DERPT|nr:54S ribosomal protein L2 mitochondrial [Dermatophagoides pteronyssinus]
MNNLRLLLNSSSQLFSQINNVIVPTLIPVRFRRVFPIIRGPPRPLPPNIVRPESSKYNWKPIYPLDNKYTIKPLKIKKLGGRHPETGRVVVKTIGGGNKKYFRWIDYERHVNPDGSPREEKVFNIRYDPLRSTKLALVAGGDRVRWIVATEKMQIGDIIRTYSDIPRNPIRPREADSHPIGALPIGTKVHNVQIIPNEPKTTILYAGQYAELIRRVGRRNYLVESRGKREFCIDQTCMVTVGCCSNPYHDEIDLMCPQRRRWLGKRPKSGAWHKKDGYCGRKIHPPKPVRDHFSTAMMLQKSGQTMSEITKEKQKEFYVIE